MNNEKYSLHLNEARKNLAAPGKLLLPSPKSAYFWCSTTYIPVGDLDQSPLIHSYWLCIGGRSTNLVCHISPELRSLHAICGLAITIQK